MKCSITGMNLIVFDLVEKNFLVSIANDREDVLNDSLMIDSTLDMLLQKNLNNFCLHLCAISDDRWPSVTCVQPVSLRFSETYKH